MVVSEIANSSRRGGGYALSHCVGASHPRKDCTALSAQLSALKKDGILKSIRPASGRRSEVLALGQLINLAEGRKVIPQPRC